ncbi:MAG TPA: MFS transporter, partial [Chloroflexota bacterium]
GVAHFVPNLAMSFLGGALADTRDRRLVIAVAQIAPFSASLLLAALTATGTISLTAIYLAVGFTGLASAFDGPARGSLLPQVVARTSFQRAVTVSNVATQLARVLGPAAAGLLIAQFDVAPVYLLHVGMVLVGLAFLAGITIPASSNPTARLNLALVKEGFAFMWSHPAILGTMTLDMFAVIFAGVDALLPIYARDILGVGAAGYGLLASAKAVGALITSVTLTFLPPIVGTGRVLVITLALYGLATIGFGLSVWFPLSLILYGLTAVFDQVGVVVRQSIIQLGTPDALRGRVNAANQLFIASSNQLGPVESGLVATWTSSAVFAVVTGGIGCVAAVAVIAALIPALWHHRSEP